MGVENNKRLLGELLGADDLLWLDRLLRAGMVNHVLAPDRPARLAALASSSRRWVAAR